MLESFNLSGNIPFLKDRLIRSARGAEIISFIVVRTRDGIL